MKKILLITILLTSNLMFSQFMKVLEGDLKSLKEFKDYDVIFDYNGVMIPKFDSEDDFLKDKMDKREEKEVGAGEVFRISWFNDREEKYHPEFIEAFNKTLKKNDVIAGEDSNIDATILIRTTEIYPGYNVGISSNSAYIRVEIIVYQKSYPDNILVKVQFKKSYGSSEYNGGDRIAHAYKSLGSNFAYSIKRKALKE